ncbi:MAG: hypothetical protein LKJ99_00195 [Acidaminococcaceae bacterium]|jgi:hypothetical protein|nr:hypothetical protein [Acidaminococcaceae bacterium]
MASNLLVAGEWKSILPEWNKGTVDVRVYRKPKTTLTGERYYLGIRNNVSKSNTEEITIPFDILEDIARIGNKEIAAYQQGQI